MIWVFVLAGVTGVGLGLLPWRVSVTLVAGYVLLTVGMVAFGSHDAAALFAYSGYVIVFQSPLVVIGWAVGGLIRRYVFGRRHHGKKNEP